MTEMNEWLNDDDVLSVVTLLICDKRSAVNHLFTESNTDLKNEQLNFINESVWSELSEITETIFR